MKLKTLAFTLAALALTACGTSAPQHAQSAPSSAGSSIKAECLGYVMDTSLLQTYNKHCPSRQSRRFAAAAAAAEARYAQPACRNQVSDRDIESAARTMMSHVKEGENVCVAVRQDVQRAAQRYNR